MSIYKGSGSMRLPSLPTLLGKVCLMSLDHDEQTTSETDQSI
ncbi:hypothetical protein [Vibrio sp. S9_S30]|nr:hypothetical protein [Vibrio sp. S9_S30]